MHKLDSKTSNRLKVEGQKNIQKANSNCKVAGVAILTSEKSILR